MIGSAGEYNADRWRASRRLSLAESAQLADGRALAEVRNRRSQGIWHDAIVELAESGADLRPVLANLPGLGTAAAAGRSIRHRAQELRKRDAQNLTNSASYYVQAARLLERAGFRQEAELCDNDAFACIQDAVREGATAENNHPLGGWQYDQVHVSAPPRIDLGGGWSDTPPFCFDWGGTVLNCALEIEGDYPIETEIVRISDPVIRCIADGNETVVEYRSTE